MKKLIEGKDYSIHEYVTKNKRKNSNKPMCPICQECKNKKICLNRRTLYTMKRCEVCCNCKDKEHCDKFYIYIRYMAELLNLGRNKSRGYNQKTVHRKYRKRSI